jgi:hypothetical protein
MPRFQALSLYLSYNLPHKTNPSLLQGLDWDEVLKRKVPAPYKPPVSGETGVENFEEVHIVLRILNESVISS